jgi:hypothetical protein
VPSIAATHFNPSARRLIKDRPPTNPVGDKVEFFTSAELKRIAAFGQLRGTALCSERCPRWVDLMAQLRDVSYTPGNGHRPSPDRRPADYFRSSPWGTIDLSRLRLQVSSCWERRQCGRPGTIACSGAAGRNAAGICPPRGRLSGSTHGKADARRVLAEDCALDERG